MPSLLLAAALMLPQADAPSRFNDALMPPPERWVAFRVNDSVYAYDAAQTPHSPPDGVVAMASLLWSPDGVGPPGPERAAYATVIHRIDCAAPSMALSEITTHDGSGRMIEHTLGQPSAGSPPPADGPAAILFRAVCGGEQPAPLFAADSQEALLARLASEFRR